MIEPKSNGKTMKQLKAYWKSSKGTNKSYWAGRIDGLKGRVFPYVQRLVRRRASNHIDLRPLP